MQHNEVRVQDGPLAATVLLPASWTVVPDSGPQRIAFPDPATYAGDGFSPNVTVRVDRGDASQELPESVLVLSDRSTSDPEGGDHRRTRLAVSRVADDAVTELITTVQSGDGLLSVVCTATEAQWAGLADAFDSLSATARVGRTEAGS